MAVRSGALAGYMKKGAEVACPLQTNRLCFLKRVLGVKHTSCNWSVLRDVVRSLSSFTGSGCSAVIYDYWVQQWVSEGLTCRQGYVCHVGRVPRVAGRLNSWLLLKVCRGETSIGMLCALVHMSMLKSLQLICMLVCAKFGGRSWMILSLESADLSVRLITAGLLLLCCHWRVILARVVSLDTWTWIWEGTCNAILQNLDSVRTPWVLRQTALCLFPFPRFFL